MDRHCMSLKKADMISKAQKSNTANPFLIYDFYELLDKVVTENQLGPSQI